MKQKRSVIGGALSVANFFGLSPFNPPLIPSNSGSIFHYEVNLGDFLGKNKSTNN